MLNFNCRFSSVWNYTTQCYVVLIDQTYFKVSYTKFWDTLIREIESFSHFRLWEYVNIAKLARSDLLKMQRKFLWLGPKLLRVWTASRASKETLTMSSLSKLRNLQSVSKCMVINRTRMNLSWKFSQWESYGVLGQISRRNGKERQGWCLEIEPDKF